MSPVPHGSSVRLPARCSASTSDSSDVLLSQQWYLLWRPVVAALLREELGGKSVTWEMPG